MITAEQAIHDYLWKALSAMLPGRVYESRPMTYVGYPFSDFEDFNTGYTVTKSGVLPQVSISLNIWDAEDNRKNVSDLCENVLNEAMTMSEAYGFRLSLRGQESGLRIVQDRTVTPPVWRGMVNLTFDIL